MNLFNNSLFQQIDVQAVKKVVVVCTSMMVTIMPAIEANAKESFLHPRLGGRPVARCFESYRYPDHCSKAATEEAAHRFCRYQGHSQAQKWSWIDAPWENRVAYYIAYEKYDNGNLNEGWRPHEGGFYFTGIVCND